jgi:hypothetical protein
MADPFFERPILNSPYDYPTLHWELDGHGQPTQQIIEQGRRADFIMKVNGAGSKVENEFNQMIEQVTSQVSP